MGKKILFSTNKSKLIKWNALGDEFLNVNFKLQGNVYDFNLKKDLKDFKFDDPASIAASLSRQPANYFKWAMMQEIAEKNVTILERSYDLWYAKKRQIVKKILEKSAEKHDRKAPTKEDIENEIKLLSEYKEKKTMIDNARFKAKILTIAVNAWGQKKDMLQSINKLMTTMMEHKLS